MKIFYLEYAILAVFIIMVACRIIKDVPDADDRKRRQRLARDAGARTDRKSAKRKEKRLLT